MVRYWSIMTRPTGSPAVGIPISIAKASESVGADCGGATPADGAGRGGKTPRVRGSWMTMDFFQWTTFSVDDIVDARLNVAHGHMGTVVGVHLL